MNNTVTENTRLHLHAAVAKLSEIMTKDAPEFHAESIEAIGRRIMELGKALNAIRAEDTATDCVIHGKVGVNGDCPRC